MLKQAMATTAICVLSCFALAIDAGAAATSEVGPLKGRTRQGRTIRLAAHRRTVQIKHFSIELRCRDGSYLIDEESGFVPARLGRGDRIRDHQVGNTDDVWIRGRLSGRVLRGVVRVHDRLGRVQCDSRWVRFHAML